MQTQKSKSSVKTKLILAMILLPAIPLLIVIIMSYSNTMKTSLADAEEVNEKQVDIIHRDVQSLVNQSFRAIEAVAGNPGTIDFVKMSEAERNAVSGNMATFLANVDKSLGDSNSTVISDATGQNLVRSRGNLTNVGERDYFKTAITGVENLSEVSVSKTTGSRIVVPAVPIFDLDGTTPIGAVTRNFDIGVLYNFLKEETGANQTIVICGTDGNVIAHSGHEITADMEADNRSSAEYYQNAQKGEGTIVGTIDGKKYIISYVKDDVTGWTIINERDYNATMKSATVSAIIQVVVSLIAMVVATVIAVMMAQGFVGPVYAVNATLKKLSEGEFEHIDSRYLGRTDEFGEMIEETEMVIEKLQSIVSGIKENAASIGASSEELADTTDQISQTADDVSNAVQDIASGATQQAEEIQHATENTGLISENIQAVTDNAAQLDATARNMSDNSRESASELEKLRESSAQMQVAINEISEKIGATSQAVAAINAKVEAINGIASQTNLLALNASIEAARAGDAGRGFAVVAQEIGTLAEDSAKSANEIRKEMENLLSESQAAVKQAGTVHEAMEEQNEILSATVDSVNRLIEDIQTTVEGVDNIAGAAKRCEESKEVIVDAMNSLSAISEENAASSEETGASMEELGATVTTLASAANDLSDIAAKLNEEMKFFK